VQFMDSSGTPAVVGSMDISSGIVDFEDRAIFGSSTNTLKFLRSGSDAMPLMTAGAINWDFSPDSDAWTPVNGTIQYLSMPIPWAGDNTVLSDFKVFFEMPDATDSAQFVCYVIESAASFSRTTLFSTGAVAQTSATSLSGDIYYLLGSDYDSPDLPYSMGTKSAGGDPETLWLYIGLDDNDATPDSSFLGVEWEYEEIEY